MVCTAVLSWSDFWRIQTKTDSNQKDKNKQEKHRWHPLSHMTSKTSLWAPLIQTYPTNSMCKVFSSSKCSGRYHRVFVPLFSFLKEETYIGHVCKIPWTLLFPLAAHFLFLDHSYWTGCFSQIAAKFLKTSKIVCDGVLSPWGLFPSTLPHRTWLYVVVTDFFLHSCLTMV